MPTPKALIILEKNYKPKKWEEVPRPKLENISKPNSISKVTDDCSHQRSQLE
jgi:hypothetical protein